MTKEAIEQSILQKLKLNDSELQGKLLRLVGLANSVDQAKEQSSLDSVFVMLAKANTVDSNAIATWLAELAPAHKDNPFIQSILARALQVLSSKQEGPLGKLARSMDSSMHVSPETNGQQGTSQAPISSPNSGVTKTPPTLDVKTIKKIANKSKLTPEEEIRLRANPAILGEACRYGSYKLLQIII